MRTHSLRLFAAIAVVASLAACVPSPTAATGGTLDESSAPGIERAPSPDLTSPPDTTTCAPLDEACHAIQPWY